MFGEEFQSKHTSVVEKETALAKAVSISKRHKKEELPSQQEDRAPDHPYFFRKGLPWQVQGQVGQEF